MLYLSRAPFFLCGIACFVLLFIPAIISSAQTENTVVISEVLPSPEGADAENEWIELYNQSISDADLSGWQIRDLFGTTKTYKFPLETKISAKDFLLIPRPSSKITLNNDKDGLELVSGENRVVDAITYEKAPQGQSFNRTPKGFFWSKTLTPDRSNIISLPEKAGVEKLASTAGKTAVTEQRQSQKILDHAPEKNLSPLPFLPAALTAIFSTTAVLVLKKRVKS